MNSYNLIILSMQSYIWLLLLHSIHFHIKAPSFFLQIYGIIIEPQQHERNREKKNIISKIITMLKAKEEGGG